MSNSQLNKLKSRIQNGTEVNLDFSSKVVDDSDYNTNFPHKSLLIDRNVSRIRKDFANNSSTNRKLSKTQIVQSGGFVSILLASFLKTSMFLMKNKPLLKPLAKRIIMP